VKLKLIRAVTRPLRTAHRRFGSRLSAGVNSWDTAGCQRQIRNGAHLYSQLGPDWVEADMIKDTFSEGLNTRQVLQIAHITPHDFSTTLVPLLIFFSFDEGTFLISRHFLMKFSTELSAAALFLSLSSAAAAWEGASLVISIAIVKLTGSLPANAHDFASYKFDFLVVGGGTAGLAVAARLSEDPKIMVGVIEAGQYRPGDPVIEVPQSSAAPGNPNGTVLLGNPTYDWNLVSTPQPGLNGISLPLAR
jgi:hypothetical protein